LDGWKRDAEVHPRVGTRPPGACPEWWGPAMHPRMPKEKTDPRASHAVDHALSRVRVQYQAPPHGPHAPWDKVCAWEKEDTQIEITRTTKASGPRRSRTVLDDTHQAGPSKRAQSAHDDWVEPLSYAMVDPKQPILVNGAILNMGTLRHWGPDSQTSRKSRSQASNRKSGPLYHQLWPRKPHSGAGGVERYQSEYTTEDDRKLGHRTIPEADRTLRRSQRMPDTMDANTWATTMKGLPALEDVGSVNGDQREHEAWLYQQAKRSQENKKQQVLPTTLQGARMPSRKMTPGPRGLIKGRLG